MMSQTKKKRLISSVHMYLGMKSVYLEKICRLTGTNNSNTMMINKKDSKASIRCNIFFIGMFE
jgi:hypothetical protein